MASTEWDEWERRALESLAKAIKKARSDRGMSQAALGDAVGLSQGAIANLESKGRVTELPKLGLLVKLSVALGIPPVQLIYPDLPDGKVEVWPGVNCTSIEALQWFSGDLVAWAIHRTPETEQAHTEQVTLSRRLRDLRYVVRKAQQRIMTSQLMPGSSDPMFPGMTTDEVKRVLDDKRQELADLKKQIQKRGWTVNEDTNNDQA